MRKCNAYRCSFGVVGVDIVHSSEFLRGFDDSRGLDGDAVSKAAALAVDDAGDEEVTSYAVGFCRRDDGVVCVDGLVFCVTSGLVQYLGFREDIIASSSFFT